MNEAPQRRARFRRWIPPVAVWIFLVGVAGGTTRFAYAPVDFAAIAALYALLALFLDAIAGSAARLGLVGKLAAAALVGIALGWHLREQTRTEGVGPTLWTAEGLSGFLALAAGLAVAYLLIAVLAARRDDPSVSVGRSLAGAVIWAIAFVGLLAAVFYGSGTMRWHLLRHNKMIGTPAFHLFATPVAAIEGDLWTRRSAPGAARASGAAPPQGASPEAVASREATTPERPPDIVFVLVDTLRADALAAYGGDPAWMPAVNRLAGESLLFRDVRSNSSWTRPSVASFFTGLTPEEHGAIFLGFGLAPQVPTLAEVLGERGYETAAFIANRRVISESSGLARGFDLFDLLDDPPDRYARADYVTDRVAGWLRQRPDDAPPLFLYVHYFDPHIPYLSSDHDPASSPTSHAVARSLYEDELRFLDGHLAALLDELDRDLDGPRLTLLTSDHGEEFGEHDGRGHAQTLYWEVLDIPAIVRYTTGGGPAGRITAGPGSVDARLEGRDFFDLLVRASGNEPLDAQAWARAADRTTRTASVSFTKSTGRSALVHYLLRPYRHQIFARLIERDDWRLIWSAFGPTVELYHRRNDAAELRNLAAAEPRLVRSLVDELAATPPHWTRLFPTGVSQEALDDLRALGYIR